MKVKTITPTKDRENRDLWKVEFEEDTRSMWLGFAPKFTVGDIIEDDKLQQSKTGKSWIFKRTESKAEVKTAPKQERFYHDRHSQDAEDWTNIRTAVMQAVALQTHLVPGAKVDVKGVMQNASEIFASMCVLKPERSKDA